MQKRLLALVATVAMVLSMFAGIAFAAPQDEPAAPAVTPVFADVKAKFLDGNRIELTEAVEYKIVGATEDDLVAIINKDKTVGYARANADGEATVKVPAGTKLDLNKQDLAELTVEVAGEVFILYIRPVTGVMLDAPSFTWPLYKGASYFKYEGLVPAGITAIKLEQADGAISYAATIKSGVFWFSVPKTDFVPGDLYVIGVRDDENNTETVLVKGEVKANELDITRIAATRTEFVAGLEQDFRFTIDVEDLALKEGENNRIQVVFEDAKGAKYTFESDVFADDAVEVVVEGDLTATNRGEMTATVNLQVKEEGTNWFTAYTNEVDCTVKRAGTVTVSGLPAKGQLQFGVATPFDGKVYYRDEVYDDVVVVLNGAGYVNTRVEAGHNIPAPTAFGDVDVVLTAYDEDGDAVYTATYTWKVVGIKVELSSPVIVKGEATDFVVTVTDQDGKPINNAKVTLTHTNTGHKRVIEKGTKNISDGEYTFAFKGNELIVNTSGLIEVEVQAAPYTRTLEVLVLGDEGYTVTLDDAFLRGVKHTPVVTVKDGDDKVTGLTYYLVKPNGDIEKKTLSSSSKLTINANDAAGEYTLYAVGSSKYGVATYELLDPVLELEAEKLTDKVTSELSFRLLDPTNDNEPLDWDITLDVNFFKSVTAKQNKASVPVDSHGVMEIIPDADGFYTVQLTIDADFAAAGKVDEVPHVVVSTDAIDLETVIEIGKAQFTVTPENPVGDVSSTVVFKLVDANGNGLEGYEVVRGSNKLGKTNEDGELAYTARFVDHTTFTVALDVKDTKLEVTVKPSADIAAPTVTYEEEVDTPQTTIVISDNVRLTRIRINGEEIDFFATDRYEYVANLVPGVNKFRIEVQDSNFNSEVYNIEIVYNAKSTVLEGDKVQRQGEYLFVQLRQFEELGAEFAWNQEAKVATFVVGDTKVEVTIGSTTAKVNGEAVTMPVAAFIDAAQGRTYVPVRFVSEALGWNVHWAAGDIVTITLK